MAVTGMANLAIKVTDIEGALAFYRGAGFTVTEPEEWAGARRAEVFLGPLQITLFTRAIYDDVHPMPEGFLHPALFTDDLDAPDGTDGRGRSYTRPTPSSWVRRPAKEQR